MQPPTYFMRRLSVTRHCWCIGAILLPFIIALTSAGAPRTAALQREFRDPPAAARPWVYWFWLNGNITSNGITADLEAMQRASIGGVLIMEVDQGTPVGAAPFGSAVSRDLFKHVCAEANRLGLEVNMNNDAGWCGSGAPFITPDLAMQKLVWTETNVQGPLEFEGNLSQPTTVSNYFKDIALLAFPTPTGDVRIPEIDGKAAFAPRHIPVPARFGYCLTERAFLTTRFGLSARASAATGSFPGVCPRANGPFCDSATRPPEKTTIPLRKPGAGWNRISSVKPPRE